MSAPANWLTTADGRVAALCQCCGAKASATRPDNDGQPNLWAMARGWSCAPFPADFRHADGSVGSTYTCPACNRRLRRGETLQRRSTNVVFEAVAS